MASLKTISFLFLVLILISDSSTTHCKRIRDRNKPCKRLAVYFHDIFFTGNNAQNSTSAIVGAPAWGNKTALANPLRYGDLVAFDDPITRIKTCTPHRSVELRASICTPAKAHSQLGSVSPLCSTPRSTREALTLPETSTYCRIPRIFR